MSALSVMGFLTKRALGEKYSSWLIDMQIISGQVHETLKCLLGAIISDMICMIFPELMAMAETQKHIIMRSPIN